MDSYGDGLIGLGGHAAMFASTVNAPDEGTPDNWAAESRRFR
jgi:hypothetical protein